MIKRRGLRSIIAIAALGGVLLSSVGLSASLTPATAATPTDYGIYGVQIAADGGGGFSLGSFGNVTYSTYASDAPANPMTVKAGEQVVRTLTLPDGFELVGGFAGSDACPGTGVREFTTSVCRVVDNKDGTHSYESTLTYTFAGPNGEPYRLTGALHASVRVQLTGDVADGAKVSVSQTLAPGFEASPGSSQSGSASINVNKVAVSFDSAGGSAVAAVTGVTAGSVVARPADPTYRGYTFLGWFLNGVAYDFAKPVNANLQLLAQWEKNDVDVDNKDGKTNYTVSAGNVSVEGGSHKVTVLLADKNGDPVAGKKSLLKASTSNALGSGAISGFQEASGGEYVASVTSSVVGSKAIAVAYNGKPLTVKQGGNAAAVFSSADTGTRCTPPRAAAVFADTPLGHKFYKEIDWMECMKYSTGWRQPVGKPLYKPADNLSREAMAAFIYRMETPKGYTAPKVSPFADMKAGDPFYKEISWMYESKLSTGWAEPSGKPTFRPKAKLSREAMAAFIYRMEAPKSYTAPMSSPLLDMKPGMKFYKEISWMYDEKLTTGNKTAKGKEYWPKDELSRQAMAAFIYRLVLDYRA